METDKETRETSTSEKYVRIVEKLNFGDVITSRGVITCGTVALVAGQVSQAKRSQQEKPAEKAKAMATADRRETGPKPKR